MATIKLNFTDMALVLDVHAETVARVQAALDACWDEGSYEGLPFMIAGLLLAHDTEMQRLIPGIPSGSDKVRR
ncbi:hypothetical protein [Microvirga sp. 2TAF3]|uniref:hypothetical protein n=1 Tax=Microvirga sp. 2TAF3 TaxID=3233014 RepID=UPI003F946D60